MENEIIENLLVQYREHREAIQVMIADLELLREKIDSLFPEGNLDKRFLRFFEEKVKTSTELFKTLLDMRKEIGKSLKDEIDIRRKIDLDSEGGDGFEDFLDIRKLAKKVENLNKKSSDIKEKVTVIEGGVNNEKK